MEARIQHNPTSNQIAVADAATANRQRLAIAAYSRCGVVSEACREANIDRSTWYAWLKDDAFALAAKEAFDQSTDRLVQALHNRAIDKSDIAAFFLLKARHPELYRDYYQPTDWKGKIEVTVTHRLLSAPELEPAGKTVEMTAGKLGAYQVATSTDG